MFQITLSSNLKVMENRFDQNNNNIIFPQQKFKFHETNRKIETIKTNC